MIFRAGFFLISVVVIFVEIGISTYILGQDKFLPLL